MSTGSDPCRSIGGQRFIVLFVAVEGLYINFKFTCLTKISKWALKKYNQMLKYSLAAESVAFRKQLGTMETTIL